MIHRILIEFAYDLPDSVKERESLYGTSDPAECFKIDLENDPGATLMEYAEIVHWNVISPNKVSEASYNEWLKGGGD